MEKIGRMALLHDIYGALLTPKQANALTMFYEEDLSLGEIAEIIGVSRQAVYDMLKRSEETLEKYEAKLGVLQKDLETINLLNEAMEKQDWQLVQKAKENLKQ